MFGLTWAAYYSATNGAFTSRLLNTPVRHASDTFRSLGDLPSQLLLSHIAAEQSRFFLARFSEIEIGLGLVLTATLLLGTHTHRLAVVMPVAMTLITVLLRFFIGSQMAMVGRELDFVADASYTEQGGTLWTLQMTYAALVAIKMIMGAALTWYLLTFKSKFRRASKASAASAAASDWGV